MGTVAVVKADRPRSIDGHDEVDSQDPVAAENLLPNEGPRHCADDRLNLVDLQIRKSRVQGIAVREAFHTKEGLEFADRWAVTEQESDLSSRFESKQKQRDSGKGETGKGITDLHRIPRISDMGEERGKNHQRNGGGYRSERALGLVVLPGSFLRGQKLSLGLRDLRCKALQKLPFLNPFLHLRTKFDRNI